jgi:hypothetical protein
MIAGIPEQQEHGTIIRNAGWRHGSYPLTQLGATHLLSFPRGDEFLLSGALMLSL